MAPVGISEKRMVLQDGATEGSIPSEGASPMDPVGVVGGEALSDAFQESEGYAKIAVTDQSSNESVLSEMSTSCLADCRVEGLMTKLTSSLQQLDAWKAESLDPSNVSDHGKQQFDELRTTCSTASSLLEARIQHTVDFYQGRIKQLSEEIALTAVVDAKPPVVSVSGYENVNDQLDSLLSRVNAVIAKEGPTSLSEGQLLSLLGSVRLQSMVPSSSCENAPSPSRQKSLSDTSESATENAFDALKFQTERIKRELGLVWEASDSPGEPGKALHSNKTTVSAPDLGNGVPQKEADDFAGSALLKHCYMEEMQQGSWFFRVGRKFGAIGRALKSSFCRRTFLWVSYDFRNLFCSGGERPVEGRPLRSAGVSYEESSNAEGSKHTGKSLVIVIPLDSVVGFVFGENSRAYRVQEGRPLGARQLPHLCFSIWSKSKSLDLVALNEQEAERWYFGLNSLLPLFPGRTFLTPEEFMQQRERLKVAHYQRGRPQKKKRAGRGMSESVSPMPHHFAPLYYNNLEQG